MVKVVFVPPIADRIRKIEHCVTRAGGDGNVASFIEYLRAEPVFAPYFEHISQYCPSGKFFENVIILVNGSVVEELSEVKDGDLVNILLPLAGG